MALFTSLLPPECVVVESTGTPPLATFLAGEETAVARAIDRRRREYADVRRCARDAMALLGLPSAAVTSGPRGEPQWPEGVIGSMTHCEGFRACALVRTAAGLGIGIDAEPDAALPPGVIDLVASPAEQRGWGAQHTGRVAWDRLLFSAKESLYKAWFPITRAWLDFADAKVTLGVGGDWRAEVRHDDIDAAALGMAVVSGRWRAVAGLVLTSCVIPSR